MTTRPGRVPSDPDVPPTLTPQEERAVRVARDFLRDRMPHFALRALLLATSPRKADR